MDKEIPEDIQLKLLKLCTELHLFLNKTESCLHLSKEEFKQVDNVTKPWKISNNNVSGKDVCLCKSLSIVQENDEESDLLSNISKTLNNAEVMRKKSLGVKSNLQRSSESALKTKTKVSVSVKKSTSVQATTKGSEHSPCCPLFKTTLDLTQKYLNLPEALDCYKIPHTLRRIVEDSKDMLRSKQSNTGLKNSYKDIFMKTLEAQNEKFCSSYQENDSSITTFLTYISALNSYETKRTVYHKSWMLYNNIQDLESFQTVRFNITTKESWVNVLNFIKTIFISNLEDYELNQKQKIYLFKILKTICNFVYSSVPNIPIFTVVRNSPESE